MNEEKNNDPFKEMRDNLTKRINETYTEANALIDALEQSYHMAQKENHNTVEQTEIEEEPVNELDDIRRLQIKFNIPSKVKPLEEKVEEVPGNKLNKLDNYKLGFWGKIKKVKFEIISSVVITGALAFGAYLIGDRIIKNSEKNQQQRLEIAEKQYQKSKETITGTVLEEYYYPYIGKDNESKYTIKIRTDEGKIIAVSIKDTDGDWKLFEIAKKKESIDALISKGTRISFPKGNIQKIFYEGHPRYGHHDETWFYESTLIGNKKAHRITILTEETTAVDIDVDED